MCMCIVFAFQLIRAKEVRIDIEVKRSEEKWREVITCDVSPVAMFFWTERPVVLLNAIFKMLFNSHAKKNLQFRFMNVCSYWLCEEILETIVAYIAGNIGQLQIQRLSSTNILEKAEA